MMFGSPTGMVVGSSGSVLLDSFLDVLPYSIMFLNFCILYRLIIIKVGDSDK